MNKTAIKLISVCLLLVGGCDFLKEHEKAAIGTGAGAAGGAIIGGIANGRKGAIYGGLIGALAGGAIGAYLDYKDKDATTTNKDKQYTPDQGVKMDLERVAATPASIVPGEKINLQMTYALMAPDAARSLDVTEKRVVTFNDIKVAETQVTIRRTPGTYTSEISITLPVDAEKGTYGFEGTVGATGVPQRMTTTFVVK